MEIQEFQEFNDWLDEAMALEVNGTLCQMVKEKWDDNTVCAIHFGDISEDVSDLDMDNDIDRFGFGILSAYLGDCEVEMEKDQYDRPYASVKDLRCDDDEDNEYTIRRLFWEGE